MIIGIETERLVSLTFTVLRDDVRSINERNDIRQNFETADAAQLKVPTSPMIPKIGIEAARPKEPRPDLNGLRIKSPNRPEIFLVDRGYRRMVPTPNTYNDLFKSWEQIAIIIDIDEIPEAVPLPDGAILAKGGRDPIYLIDRDVKRQIMTPGAIERYHFNLERVYVVPRILLENIRTGPSITWAD